MVSRTIGTVEPRISPLDAEELREQMDDSPLCESKGHAMLSCSFAATATAHDISGCFGTTLVCANWVEVFELLKNFGRCPCCHRPLPDVWVVVPL